MPRSTRLLTQSRHYSAGLAPARSTIAWGGLARHYLEMVITMVVGMIVLHPLWAVALDALKLPNALHHATVMALVMATNMSLGMGAWMRYRTHSWRSIIEMSATMYLPFVALLPPVWAGAISGGAMITAGHLIMLPTMLVLMLWRRDQYGHGLPSASHNRTPAHAPDGSPAAKPLSSRNASAAS